MFERLVSDVPFVGPHRARRRLGHHAALPRGGGGGPAFESIVGSGPTGARPHARAGDRVIESGELVVIDTGATVDGYVSDYTRTFATGELHGEMREAYDTVLAAQQAGLDGIRAGDDAASTRTRLARGVIDGSRFAGTFGHGLGHGLGLDVHESPRLSTGVDRHARAGQRRHGGAGRLPRRPLRRPDRGRRRRHRRRHRESRRFTKELLTVG